MTNARVLVVEDEAVVAMDIEHRLINLGHTVVGVTARGEEAVRLAKELRPDLILMDIHLQGDMDGVTAAEQIQECFEVPVVYVTAHADEVTIQRAKISGPFGYVLKPFDERELRTVIEMALYKHEADRKLRASERRYAMMLASIADAVIATDIQGRVTFLNRVAEKLTGWSLADATGRAVADVFRVVDEETRQPASDAVDRVLGEGVAVEGAGERILLRSDGREVVIDDSVSPIRDEQGRCTGVVLVFRDATEKRRAEAELQRTRSMLEQLFEQSPGAIVVVGREGNIRRVNAEAERVFGYRREEMLGQKVELLVRDSTKEYHARLREGYMVNPSTRSMAIAAEISGRRKDGSEFPAQVLLAPIDTPEGMLVLSITTDRTERRLLEEQLRQAQKMDAVGQLAGGVAHDFNNLLTIIIGYTRMVLDGVGADHPWYGFLTEAYQAAERAADLTRQLLAFSRKQLLQPKIVDLNQVLAHTTKMLSRLIGEQVELSVSTEVGALLVKADPGQLEQVIVNLAVNARDAMPAGGRLTLATACVDIGGHGAQPALEMLPGRYARLTVNDTGCGMDAAIKARIFEPFFTTKGVGEGTGLGLATVYGIVKQTGGHIDVVSKVGKGTTFSIYFPALEEALSREETQPRLTQLPQGAETILLVEDEGGVCTLGREVLQRCGYTVLEARHGREALDLMAFYAGPLQLLVTDVVMPQMHGRTLATLLTAQRPGLKVLFVTGYADPPLLDLGLSDGEVSLLMKPFTPSSLARKVREVLDQRPGSSSTN
ncbi:MAG TPA: PAS domain S-box protein [Gemmataceae bacterium]|nr:PAS domain S-box protein [Gemmataceae bacterium]